MLTQKPRKYYKDTGNRCHDIRLTYTISKDHIIMALQFKISLDYNENIYKWFENYTPTQASVTEEIKQQLKWYGEGWMDNFFEARSDRDGRAIDEGKWEMAEKKAKELFPRWFQNFHNKSMRFIQD